MLKCLETIGFKESWEMDLKHFQNAVMGSPFVYTLLDDCKCDLQGNGINNTFFAELGEAIGFDYEISYGNIAYDAGFMRF